ncbi:MAG: DNA primase [candidate division Zixibacteria bacterium]|nr:DNA primase [candidate division Zixibacteria bacterium]
MIPPGQIEQIKESNDIVDVVGSFIRLSKRGRNYLALCPFHSEKTPSFTVSPDKQIYYCFGCGAGGNVINFVMNYEKMGFIEALKLLAEKSGITISESSAASSGSPEIRDRIYSANKIAQEYFIKALQHPDFKNALEYLRDRKIPSAAVKEFGIGYSPDITNGLIRYAGKKGIKPEILISAGLAVEYRSGYRDFFRGRLIFPIRNLSDRVVAFAGRTLKDGDTAKYINTPETPAYQKGSQLFGLNLTKDFIRKTKEVVIVEGYTDLISLYVSGIKNVVCSSGTAFTSGQASLISRFADKVITLFDSDAAGLKAAGRSVGELLSKSVDVTICVLPGEEDPDSFIKSKGVQQLKTELNNAMSYPEFKKKIVGKSFSELSVGNQEELVMEISEVIYRIDDPLKRRLFSEQVDRIFDFPISVYISKRGATKEEPGNNEILDRNRTTLEREFLSLLSENQSSIPDVSEKINPECFTDPGCQLVYVRMIDEYSKFNSVEIRKWVGMNMPANIIETLANMEKSSTLPLSNPGTFEDYVNMFQKDFYRNKLRTIKLEIVEAEKAGDKERAKDLQKRYLRILTGMANS